MDWFPDEPDVPAMDRVEGLSSLRYEDVSQEGQLLLLSTTHALGEVVWQKLMVKHPLSAPPHDGTLPILSRMVIEVGGGPISVLAPLETEARIQLAHGVGEDGAVDRIYFNVWTRLYGTVGRTNGPRPANAGERVQVAQLFIEHVLTRPFAAPEQRKVLFIDKPGIARVPPLRWVARTPATVLVAPPEARLVDAQPVSEAGEVLFGYNHTDSNRHVNSLVYPRLFLDAALRRFGAHGWDTRRHARRMEVAFRKPCFVGQRATIKLQALERDGEFGAIGAFVSDEAPDGRPHCTLQMWFR